MASKLTLDDVAEFTWDFGNQFFLETAKGNFVWGDPDYPGGNNTIVPFAGSYGNWIGPHQFGRCKGKHTIRAYCGEEMILL